VTRLEGSVRRGMILDSALEAFARNGYHDASMSEIADATGVTKPVLYQHFASKRDLYRELLAETGRMLVDTIVTAASGGSTGREQTELGMTAYFQWVHDNPNAFVLLFGGAARVDEEFARTVRDVEAQIADAISPLIAVELPPGEQRTMALGLIGMAEAVSRHLMATYQEGDPRQLGMQVARLAWSGLRALGGKN